MAYEYLKGLGETIGQNTSNQVTMTGNRPQATVDNGGASSSGGTATFQKVGVLSRIAVNSGGGISKTSIGAKTGSASAGSGSSSAQNIKIIAVAKKLEPAPPSGCVRVLEPERAELKAWFKIHFSPNGTGGPGTAWNEKMRLDPNFTYMQAETLAKYRNAKSVLVSMVAAGSDSGFTVAQINEIKKWWWKCHKPTYAMAAISQWRTNANWMPKGIANHYRQYARSYGWGKDKACPDAATKTSLFEFVATSNKTTLLNQELGRRTTENKVVADAATKALNEANAKVNAAAVEADRLKREAEEAKKAATSLQSTIDANQKRINELTNSLAAAPDQKSVSALQDQVTMLMDQLATAQAQASVVQQQVVQTEVLAQQAEGEVAQAQAEMQEVQVVADEIMADSQPWYMQYKWYLLGGLAAALAAGAWWYMKNRQPAVAMAKNGLPVPTSARRPSGLKGNPLDTMETFAEKVERLLSSVGYRGPLAIVVDPPHPGLTYEREIFNRALRLVENLTKSRGVKAKVWFADPEPSGVDAGHVSYAMSRAMSSGIKPTTMVVLTDGVTPWPSSAPTGVKVVVGLLGDNDNRQFFHVPQWVKKNTVWIG